MIYENDNFETGQEKVKNIFVVPGKSFFNLTKYERRSNTCNNLLFLGSLFSI